MSTQTPIPRAKKRRHSSIGQSMKRWFFLAGLGIIGFFGALGFFGKNGVLDIIRLKALLSDLHAENHNLELKQEELHEEVARLGDPNYLEYLAREQLGLMRPNEIFILLDPAQGH
jgi:cell division protein FtsB